jgi:hypothetical protein
MKCNGKSKKKVKQHTNCVTPSSINVYKCRHCNTTIRDNFKLSQTLCNSDACIQKSSWLSALSLKPEIHYKYSYGVRRELATTMNYEKLTQYYKQYDKVIIEDTNAASQNRYKYLLAQV